MREVGSPQGLGFLLCNIRVQRSRHVYVLYNICTELKVAEYPIFFSDNEHDLKY